MLDLKLMKRKLLLFSVLFVFLIFPSGNKKTVFAQGTCVCDYDAGGNCAVQTQNCWTNHTATCGSSPYGCNCFCFPGASQIIFLPPSHSMSCREYCLNQTGLGCLSVGTNQDANNFKKRGLNLLRFCINFNADCNNVISSQNANLLCQLPPPYSTPSETYWTFCRCGGSPLPILPTPLPQPILCPGEESVSTAIGCIPVSDINEFTSFIIRWAIGMGGGISFLLILLSGFIIITSSGNPQKVKAGKELLTSAISGLFLIIFSVFILEIVGLRIFRIPGL